MSLRGAIEAGQKPRLCDFTKKKFKGVLLVNQDGTLTNKGRVGRAEPGMGHTYMNVPRPPVTAGMAWDDERKPTVTQNIGLGFEGVPTDDRFPTQLMEFSMDDFFADPSALFSGPSSTGFTGLGDQGTAGDPMIQIFSSL